MKSLPASRPLPRLTASAIAEMPEPDCWRELELAAVGRLAMVGPDGIDIVPVNYLVSGRSVLFRSAPGAKLAQLTGAGDVAFEADGLDDGVRWSVVLHGHARRLDADDEIEASGILRLHPDAPREMNNFVRVTPTRITGRRFHPEH